MNSNQIQSLVRWLANAISGGVIAWSASHSDSAKGVASFIAQLVTGPDVIAAGVLGVTWLWGHLTHREATDNGSPLDKTSLYAWLLIGALALSLTGCNGAKLEGGGAYAPGFTSITTNADLTTSTNFTATAAPDYAFYQADQAWQVAYAIVDGCFNFERDNRAHLWQISPDIKHELDKIRPQAADIQRRWALARQHYLSTPTPAGLSTIQTLVTEIQNISTAAQTVTSL